MITEFAALFLFGAFVTLVWNQINKRPHNFPPGPLSIPILGHLPLLGLAPHIKLMKWKEKYGPIIGISFGSYRAVAIQDVNLIKEVWNHSSFAGRPKLNFMLARGEGHLKGIVVNEGRHWLEQRKFSSRNLRDFGLRSNTMEGSIQEEIDTMLQSFKDASGKPVQMRNAFNFPLFNIMWKILFSGPLDQADSEAREATYKITEAMEKFGPLSALSIFLPWLSKIAPDLSGYQSMWKDALVVIKFLERHIKLHSEGYVEGQPRDFVDSYEDEIRKTTDHESSFHRNQKQMVYAIQDLFGAGGETTSTTLSWMCAYLVYFPEVQKKLQAEIDDVIGTERVPLLTDRPHMPYTDAVIHEVLRYSSIVPFAVFRSTTEDVVFHGFSIPKDTMILPNIYGVHFDKNIWGDPENFRPERFLDDKGKFKGNASLLPFGYGKRACLGESLARDELFLFAANLFQTFTARPSGKLPNLEPHIGFTLSAHPFEILWEERDNEH